MSATAVSSAVFLRTPQHRQAPAQPLGDAAMPGMAAFAGSKVTGIRFDGVRASMLGSLPGQLELQPGEILNETKVRASLRRLYQSGLYDTIQVQGLPSEGGVLVVFAGPAAAVRRADADLRRQQ